MICVWDSNLEEPHTQYFRPGGGGGVGEEGGVRNRHSMELWRKLVLSGCLIQTTTGGRGENNLFGKSIKQSGLL